MLIMNSSNPELLGEINSGVILVPAEIVGRSRPSSHSVPIVRAREKVRRARPIRNVVVAVLAALLAMAGVFAATYYSVETGREAGYKLVCSTIGLGKHAQPECHWEKP